MYPSFIEDADGEEIEYPISIVKEQSGETVHFLDMEMVQSKVNLVSQIRTYDKRDHMAMLRVAEYDHRPQIPQKCRNQIVTVDKYSIATSHCQLRRFATRCAEILLYYSEVLPNSGSKTDKGHD